MKHSQLTGFFICLALIGVCFLPWVYIESKNILVTGLSAPHTNFGKPGLMIVIMSVCCAICFALPYIVLKRFNVFFTAFMMGWSIRNFIILTACFMGECPKKYPAIYFLPILCLACLLAALLYKKKL